MNNSEDIRLNDAEKKQLIAEKNFLDAKKVLLETEKLVLEKEKIDLEKIKIKQESENLAKPFYKQAAGFIAVLGFVLSIVYNVVQIFIIDDKKKEVQSQFDKAQKAKSELDGKTADATQKFKDVQGRATDAKKKIAVLIKNVQSQISPESERVLRDVFITLNRIDSLSDSLVISVKPPISKAVVINRVDKAKNEEYKGFEYLANKDIEKAYEAFNNSEKAYPGYRISYEMARILKKTDLTDEQKKAVYRTIVERYSGLIPIAFKRDIKQVAGLSQ